MVASDPGTLRESWCRRSGSALHHDKSRPHAGRGDGESLRAMGQTTATVSLGRGLEACSLTLEPGLTTSMGGGMGCLKR